MILSESDWLLLRDAVLARDNHQCQRCGSKECLVVHHKVSVRTGGSDELDNLITLCVHCHAKVESSHKSSHDLSVQRAQSHSETLRITIPEEMRKALQLQAGDQLVWEIAAEGSKIIVKVVKK